MNQVVLIGRVGKNPKTEYLPGNICKCQFPLATSEYYKKGGERHERTTWHNIVAWRKTGELCEANIVKGLLIAVQGKIENTTKEVDGVKKYYSNVVIDRVEFISPAQASKPNN